MRTLGKLAEDTKLIFKQLKLNSIKKSCPEHFIPGSFFSIYSLLNRNF